MNEKNSETEAAALSETEAALLAIVHALLKNDTISVTDDFFLTGGHSLLGTQLVMRTRKAFGVKVSMKDLFDTGTVRKLAVRVEELVMADLDAMSDDEAARINETA
jgi:acyl carrier protein